MDAQFPVWWEQIPKNRPLIYVTMGSTGRVGVVDEVIDALRELSVSVLLATSGRVKHDSYPENFYVSEYLPGLETSKRCDLVICNGGSGAVHQAIAGGTPVLGIPSNADQYYVINALESLGGGLAIRSTHVSKPLLAQAVEKLLGDKIFLTRVSELNETLSQFNAEMLLTDLVDTILKPGFD
jgi:UDP:flavonoid glycosyltransferase YjiC (YdhE family)